MLMSIAKNIIRFAINNLGYRISRTSNPNSVRDLIKRLHPIDFELIRIGGDADGGYLIPDDISGIRYCFSPGVSDSSNFEKELADRGVHCFLADYSVDNPPISNHMFSFLKKYVGPYESEQMMVFQDWITGNVARDEELILQMDIEGGEYQTLLSCDNRVLTQFRVMVIEFHSLDMLFDIDMFPIIEGCFSKLLSNFEVVHIHPNNTGTIKSVAGNQVPTTLEITFLRSDRVRVRQHTTRFPHVLDQLNVPNRKVLNLPISWHA